MGGFWLRYEGIAYFKRSRTSSVVRKTARQDLEAANGYDMPPRRQNTVPMQPVSPGAWLPGGDLGARPSADIADTTLRAVHDSGDVTVGPAKKKTLWEK